MRKVPSQSKVSPKLIPSQSQVKHDFLRRVVRLCLVMMVTLTVAAIVLAATTKSALDAATLGVLMGGWCGELLLTLLKRRWEVEDKKDDDKEFKE